MAVKDGVKGTTSINKRIHLFPHTFTIAQYVLYYNYLSHIMPKLPDHTTVSIKTSYQQRNFIFIAVKASIYLKCTPVKRTAHSIEHRD
jgi:hypothetical protein